MDEDRFLEIQEREKALWRRHPRKMTLLSCGDRECYRDGRSYDEARRLYTRVLRGDLTPAEACKQLKLGM